MMSLGLEITDESGRTAHGLHKSPTDDVASSGGAQLVVRAGLPMLALPLAAHAKKMEVGRGQKSYLCFHFLLIFFEVVQTFFGIKKFSSLLTKLLIETVVVYYKY